MHAFYGETMTYDYRFKMTIKETNYSLISTASYYLNAANLFKVTISALSLLISATFSSLALVAASDLCTHKQS